VGGAADGLDGRLGERRAGDLVVPLRAAPAPNPGGLRLRTHVSGALSAGSPRVWVGPPVPDHVDLADGTRELFLLDPLPDGGHLAFYRDPYGRGTCTLSSARNCGFSAARYAPGGPRVWLHDLTRHLSRPTHLEIQDIRLGDDGTLYFNEACQSYARDARNQCSRLVAFDPVAGRVRWRTAPLVSNAQLLVTERFVIASYGFTAEKDYVALVRRTDGRVLSRVRIDEQAGQLRLEPTRPGGPLEDIVATASSSGRETRVRIVGAGGPRPTLRVVARPAPVPTVWHMPPPTPPPPPPPLPG
jgi:hypothetical protein